MAGRTFDLAALRRYAIARTLFTPASLPRALARLGFVQADPIRAPARAQDLVLRHRTEGYRAGDLERRYPALEIEEDFFVNYGFLPRSTHALMHPRSPRTPWPAARQAAALEVLDFVRERGIVHPREVDAAFAHGKTRNGFGGGANASTQLLDAMHYFGLLRVARRDAGVRLYAERPWQPPPADPDMSLDALVDGVVGAYAPLPERSLGELVALLRGAAPQWTDQRRAALARAKARLPSVRLDGHSWYWPAGENPASRRHATPDRVWLLAPFDPLVWDRRRFELFWGWAYRLEAYVPASRRVRGYYALPLLWRERIVGWGNVGWRAGELRAEFGFVAGHAPRDAGFRRALDEELARLREFLMPR